MGTTGGIKVFSGNANAKLAEEIARHLKSLSPDESERVEKITRGIMQKVLKLPVLQLKAACKRGEAETLIDVLNDLFNLDNQPVDTSGEHH